MAARQILLAAAATAVLIGTIDAAAQSPRRPQPPPGWQAIESDIEADRAGKAEAPLQIPPALVSEVRLAEQVGAQVVAARAAPAELSDAARAALKTAEGADGRWTAVPPRPDSTDRDRYRIALVYLDPAAGFTAVNGGSARVDENGRFQWVERQPGHYSMRTRMQGVPFAHILSNEDLALLELPKVPDWLGLYRDTSDSVTRAINRGRALNHVGESRLALESLLSARSERPDAERLAFELAYAFNAIGKHERAIEVATESLSRRDNDYLTCRELGYAYFHSSRLEDAAKTYARCLTIWPDGEREIKAEVAVNLAGVYKGLGAAQQCRQWLDQAFEWSSSGSRQRSQLERMRQDADACAR
ncbi:MAG TPA: tetratricopeptide repeat protein [Burkholderiaceae bacterium]|nr:tetratricopeptide repeat protein [Burkholderiaceae bacterium]